MSLTWADVLTYETKCKRRIPIGLAFLGLGLCRVVLGWSLGLSRETPGFVLGNHILVDIGEIAGFMLVFLLVRQGQFFCSKPARFLLVGSAYVAAVAFLVAGIASGTPFLAWMALLVSGACYAILLVAWLEFYGLLTPGAMVFAYAGSAALNAFVWCLLQGESLVLSGVEAGICAVGTVALLMWLISRRQDVVEGAALQKTSTQAHKVPLGLVLTWTSIMSFAFGVGDAVTKMGYSTIAAKAGVALLGVAVVVAILVLQDKFDSSFLCTAAIVCMVMGLAATLLSEVGADVAQVLLSAGHESCMLLAYYVICARAQRNHTTAAYGASVVAGVSLVWLQVGAYSGSFILNHAGILVLFAIIIVAALTGGFLAKRQVQAEFTLMVHDDTEERIQSLAHNRGLSDRETVVYALMVQGKNAAQISEELFIAKSTVRAHMHRIYEKFGVASRQDFDRVVLEERYR